MIGRTFGLTVALVVAASAAQAGTVKVVVHDVASGKGDVMVALCDEATFLKQCTRLGTKPAARGTVEVDIKDVPAGRYAVMSFHDENGDKQMNRSKLGVPTEGAGFSRDAMGNQGPPKFADAAVAVGKGDTVVDINLTYY
ncbi:hypothetical protein BH11PSE2_BH11PSE2_06620 [soil metagenome]